MGGDCQKCGARRIDAQLGLESTPELYVQKMVEIFREVKRVLREDGTLWLNLGSSYAGSWGNSGSRPELDGTTQNQRDKHGEYFNRGGWDERREVPPNQNVPGFKPKDMIPIPWMVAMALQKDGWYLRSDIIWHKPNPMPESVTDRPTKSHEYVFLLTKSERYYYDSDAIREPCAPSQVGRIREDIIGGNRGDLIHHSPGAVYRKGRTGKTAMRGQGHFRNGDGPTNREGRDTSDVDENANGFRNKRTVWTVATSPYPEAHFATYPPDLIKPCILAGTKPGDVVLDPFFGSGTTGMVAIELGRKCIGIELNPKYVELSKQRCNVTAGLALA